ncbi:UbiA prenyltransferase family domain-containing protein [Rozella allomycis CSF55]|uniref:Heme O synthase n=1 Tax=Rozella allomycis (strain CSF55) TaxID=988480 RepID=A0A075ANF3_ROZAC|nr:UbiA prenyltransferase family domain-containing protein [Rozella allomycis CSF55]|eukprot:EPZ31334.1 UbiA prenyltransferase family domain-containing protein [Rozella allomycis CSF55]
MAHTSLHPIAQSDIQSRHQEQKKISLKWKEPIKMSVMDRIRIYAKLSKLKLGGLVAASSLCGYLIAPSPSFLMFNDFGLLLSTIVGSSLCIGAANAFNQVLEIPYDSQMSRTFCRVLPQFKISPLEAILFGICSSVVGSAILYYFVNPIVFFMGIANIILYSFIYTPLKRYSIVNTWVGAIVGALPPMSGWIAKVNYFDPCCILLGAVLFSWQFPHFNSLSWNIREQYAKAGYCMMSLLNPKLNSLTSLRYSCLLIPITCAFSLIGINDFWFMLDGNLLNILLAYRAFKFHQSRSDQNARYIEYIELFEELFSLTFSQVEYKLPLYNKQQKLIPATSDENMKTKINEKIQDILNAKDNFETNIDSIFCLSNINYENNQVMYTEYVRTLQEGIHELEAELNNISNCLK